MVDVFIFSDASSTAIIHISRALSYAFRSSFSAAAAFRIFFVEMSSFRALAIDFSHSTILVAIFG